jgi:hypothetical protein
MSHPWKLNRCVVVTIYFICCAYLVGFSTGLHSVEYVSIIFSVIYLVQFLADWVAGRLIPTANSDERERNRNLSLLVAGIAGLFVNAVIQAMALRYDYAAIPNSAFISVYCALLFLGSPMPLLPGDRLFFMAPRWARSILFLAIVVSANWRFGMLIPALFIYVERAVCRQKT